MTMLLSSKLFTRLSLGLLILANSLVTTVSYSFSADKIKKIVCVYNQPLEATQISQILDLLEQGLYTDQIDTRLFLPGTSVWIFIPNTVVHADTTKNYLVTGYQDEIEVYKKSHDKWVKIREAGKHNGSSNELAFVKLFDEVPPHPESAFLIVCRKKNNYFFSKLHADLKSPAELAAWQAEFRAGSEIYPKLTLPFLGISFTTILLLLVKFFLSKDRAYGFHAFGHMLFLVFFVLLYFQYPVNIEENVIIDPLTAVRIDKFFLFLSISCLLISIRFFYLNGKSVALNNRVTSILAFLSTLVAVLVLILPSLTERYYLINNGCMISATVITLLLAAHLIRIRDEIKNAFKIIVVGLTFLIFFVYLGFGLVLFSSRWNVGFEVLQAFPMLVGVGFSNIFIITAFAKRDHQIQQESIDLKAKVFEAEMSVVQKSLNPHFIFNCLNLIDSFLYVNNSKAARKVLFDFSDLLRMVIDRSPAQLILLSEEINMLRLYLDLEKTRSDDCFEYKITIDKLLDTDHLQIPPLLIQPIVENAVKHGILNRKKPGGQIDISITKKNPSVMKIVVEDNGVGRSLTEQLRKNTHYQSGHIGISLTKKRLEILAEVFKSESSFEIIDKADEHPGTIVTICLPILKRSADGNSLHY